MRETRTLRATSAGGAIGSGGTDAAGGTSPTGGSFGTGGTILAGGGSSSTGSTESCSIEGSPCCSDRSCSGFQLACGTGNLCQCGTGWGDCSSQAGCETSLNTVLNCNTCGNSCGGTHADPTCTNGSCVLSCEANYASCDDRDANGCESALQDDPYNCGRCGHNCQGGTCEQGLCHGVQLLSIPVQSYLGNKLAYANGRLTYLSAGETRFRVVSVRNDGSDLQEHYVWSYDAPVFSYMPPFDADEDGIFWVEQGVAGNDCIVKWLPWGETVPIVLGSVRDSFFNTTDVRRCMGVLRLGKDSIYMAIGQVEADISTLSKSGGTAVALGLTTVGMMTVVQPPAVAEESLIYFVRSSNPISIRMRAASGGLQRTLMTIDTLRLQPTSYVVGEYIYMSMNESLTTRAPLADGPTETVWSKASQFAADVDGLYFQTHPSNLLIYRLPHDCADVCSYEPAFWTTSAGSPTWASDEKFFYIGSSNGLFRVAK